MRRMHQTFPAGGRLLKALNLDRGSQPSGNLDAGNPKGLMERNINERTETDFMDGNSLL